MAPGARAPPPMRPLLAQGLWGTVLLWQNFLEQRAAVMGQKMQREIQKQVVEFLKVIANGVAGHVSTVPSVTPCSHWPLHKGRRE